MNIEIYSKEGCSYCDRAKAILNGRKIAYTEIPFSAEVTKETVQARVGPDKVIRTVPQIFVDGGHIGGYLELVEYLANNPNL